MDTLKQNTILRILWGLIALQSLVFAFDYPIAYTKDSIQSLTFDEIECINDKSVNTILYVIDIFPENSDRDSETMDYEFFELSSTLKTESSSPIFENTGCIDYKQPFFPKNYSEVFNPPPEQYYFS